MQFLESQEHRLDHFIKKKISFKFRFQKEFFSFYVFLHFSFFLKLDLAFQL